MKRTLLFFLIFLPMLASADAIEIDGIYYKLTEETKVAEVTKNPQQYKGDITIPESVEHEGITYSVTKIGQMAFEDCSSLTSATISSSVTSIEAWAFYGCTSLASITIPNSVTSIGVRAFYNCTSLTSVTIPNSVTSIGTNAFEHCTSLTSVTLSNSLTSIGESTFQNCFSLASVTIPSSVTKIDGLAFRNCSNLASVTIPNSVTEICREAFCNCTSLASISIPNSVTTIERHAFAACDALTSVTIGNGVKIIEGHAFYGCNAVTSVHISDLESLCKISFGDSWSNPLYYAHHFILNGVEVKDLVIPNSVTSIGDYTFYRCSDLASITIPNSVTNIERYAFAYCSGVTSITIGSKVESIGSYAFNECQMLSNLYCYAENVPKTQSSAFRNINIGEVTLHVPATSISAYQATEPWKNFKEIVALSNNSNTQDYFPEGTKWTEIRLDTLKYDSWYSKVGDEWVPNFETIEYYVQGDCPDRDWIYKKVYTNGPEWTDSLTLMIQEAHDSVLVSVLVHDYDGKSYVLWPGEAYQFDWSVGKGLYYENILMQNTTSISPHQYNYGIVDEIKEGDFGGVKPLKYVDLNGNRIIQGIGITEWNDGECLFGPPDPYSALAQYESYHWESYPERHYRSMLVHFERNGEVLYDVWPEKGVTYRPFVEDGKVWKCGSTAGISDGIVKMVEYYYFDGDTIIDGKTCKQMMCQRYVSPNHPDYAAMSQTSSLRYIGAWCEKDKKVYIYNAINQLKMTYDFSIEANDTLFIDNQPYVIGPKQTGGLEGFKGVYRDILWCFGGDPYYNYNTTWLEGVGGIDGPTVNVYYGEEGHGLFLMSCTVGDEVIYLNDRYEDGATPESMGARKNRFDFTHTIKTKPKARKRSEEEPLLYGEYNDLKLGINLNPLDDAYQVRITDDSGKVVYEKAINAGNIVGLNIDISAYAKGRYTVTVENSEESFTGEFYAQTTGIVEVINKTKEVRSNIYNLQGQRLSSLQKGLNIVNGQKIFVK